MPTQRIINVIPLARLRNDLDFFSYLEPASLAGLLKAGDLVKIPFRSSLIDGIVYNFPKPGMPQEFKLKELESLNIPSFLKNWQVELISEMSRRYLVSIATIAKMIVPEIPKRKKDLEIGSIDSDEIKPADEFTRPILFKYSQKASLKKIISESLEKLDKDRQLAIIVPELIDVQFVKNIFDGDEACIEYLQDANKLDFWCNWTAIAKGEARVIIGTRSAIFAPFRNLGSILIIDEEDESHKQYEPNPRYRVSEIAQFLSKKTGASIILTSRSPSLASLKKIADKEYDFIEYDKEEPTVKIELVDMSKEGLNMNFSIISTALRDRLENLEGKKALLYLDRKGYFSGIVCRDCGNQLDSKNSPALDLRSITQCPKCRSFSLRQTGKGIRQIADELKKSYPQLRIATVDKDILPAANLTELVDSNDLICCTNFGLRHLDLSKFSCLTSLSADSPLSSSDFGAAENIYTNHAKLAARLAPGQEFLIQTRNIDHYIFTALANRNLKYFYLEELKDRKNFSLPPFSRLIEIDFRHADRSKGEKELAAMSEKLSASISIGSILYPARSSFEFETQSGYHWQIIMKYPLGADYSSELSFLRAYPVTIDTSY